jgi:hypothetical protein
MKTVLLIFTLLIGLSAFSQSNPFEKGTPQPIKLENGRFYIDNIQIPSYQMKKIFATNLHSMKQYNQAKTKETLGGALLGLGSTMTVVDLAIGLFSDAKYPTALTYAGLGMVAVSIPILSGRAKKMKEAVSSYNEGLKNSSSNDFDLNAVVNQNGVGFQIQF